MIEVSYDEEEPKDHEEELEPEEEENELDEEEMAFVEQLK